MKIIDRKKNIFKLSQGEYVSVENLESIYSLASTIESVSFYDLLNVKRDNRYISISALCFRYGYTGAATSPFSLLL